MPCDIFRQLLILATFQILHTKHNDQALKYDAFSQINLPKCILGSQATPQTVTL